MDCVKIFRLINVKTDAGEMGPSLRRDHEVTRNDGGLKFMDQVQHEALLILRR